ncbi:FAD:protein FMN transferase [Daejeonella lutea]|uniref:FAD:protein FMN transferase n=1 Tax=Daejeonella lutea TaxID=572036 RepID=A0A1T5BM91_9SPHI|nr:FAD:protein FMN transferase [Daejeonella lutea]SKB48130.1 thiamine biosynthesis lipoprotein [Daejeonella lutea]
MKRILIIIFLFLAFNGSAQVLQSRAVRLMGSRFDITIVAKDSALAERYIDTVIAEVDRIENLISDWRPQTQVSEINRNAGIRPVKVDREVFELTERALYLSRITDGAFDISFAAMDRIWKFDGSMKEMPAPEAIRRSVEKVGYKNIILDRENSTVFLKLPGMKIGFGALGEGYAADQCRNMMKAKGVTAGIVNGSGDMNTWGRHPNGDSWKIGVTNPVDDNELFAILPLEEKAAVTSGSYEKYVVFNGKRYAHIINPKTGYPVSGLSSVTIVGPSAEFANGLSTSIMVLGKRRGLRLLRYFPKYRGIFVSDKGKVTTTRGMKIETVDRLQ